jgi:hypothetical protein
VEVLFLRWRSAGSFGIGPGIFLNPKPVHQKIKPPRGIEAKVEKFFHTPPLDANRES